MLQKKYSFLTQYYEFQKMFSMIFYLMIVCYMIYVKIQCNFPLKVVLLFRINGYYIISIKFFLYHSKRFLFAGNYKYIQNLLQNNEQILALDIKRKKKLYVIFSKTLSTRMAIGRQAAKNVNGASTQTAVLFCTILKVLKHIKVKFLFTKFFLV